MSNQKPSFRFEIDRFWFKESPISSETFVSGGCEWYVDVHTKRNRFAENHMSLYLYVANTESLRTGWRRSCDFYFLMLNRSNKELYKSPIAQAAINLFCAKTPARFFRKTLPLRKLEEKGFLENGKLIIEVYINVVEAVDGDVSEKKETVEINGFQVLASQATSLRKLFAEHSDIAQDFKPKNQMVKTSYMNALLNLIETLNKPSKNHSETELSNAHSVLCELMELGFKLDWLKSKLEEVCLERKKAEDADGFRVQQLLWFPLLHF